LAGRRFQEEKVEHPTQKPLSICNRIVRHFSNPGDLVVVPFAGSGSECVAAKNASRHFIGFEVNPDYVTIANRRLDGRSSNETRGTQPSLLTDAELFQVA
jgi:site-specific DNA-methyltransferase (adenine-specific)/adenine-specific DNA-methyltransferase